VQLRLILKIFIAAAVVDLVEKAKENGSIRKYSV